MSEEDAGLSGSVQEAGHKIVDGAQELADIVVDLGRDELKLAVEAVGKAIHSLGDALETLKKSM